MVWVLGKVCGFNHVLHIGQEVHNLHGVVLNRHQRWFSIFQGRLQAVTELGKGFGAFLPDLGLGNNQEIHISDPVAGMGQFIPILVFVKLTGNGVVLGVVGILEIVQIKQGFIGSGIPTTGPQVIHKADEIAVPNGQFKGTTGRQHGLCLGDHCFQLHHFMNVIIRQNREAVLVEVKGLFNPFFNAGVKGGAKDQGVVCVRVWDRIYPFHISQAVFVWASIKDFNPAVGNSHCFTPFTIVLKASKPSG